MIHHWGFSDLVVWDVKTGQLLTTARQSGHDPASFLPDGTLVYGEDDEEAIKRFHEGHLPIELVERKLMLRDPQTEKEHTAPVRLKRITAWELSRDGTLLAAKDANSCLGLWEFTTGIQRPLAAGGFPVDSPIEFSFSVTGDVLGAAYPDGSVILWYAANGQQKSRIKVPAERLPLLCRFSPDLERVLASQARQSGGQAIGSPDDPDSEDWKVWTISDNNPLARLQQSVGDRRVWFHEDGRLFSWDKVPRVARWRLWELFKAPTSFDNVIRDVDSGEVVIRIPDREDGIISPDGRLFVTWTNTGPIEVWDLPPPVPIGPVVGVAAFAGLMVGALVLYRGASIRGQRRKHATSAD
jgi:WD40 repeat protein